MQNVLITGAGSGIGRALTRLFHADGHHVIGASLVVEELATLSRELGDSRFTPLPIDLARVDAAESLFGATEAQGKRVDVLVNNAGFGLFGEHLDLDADAVTRLLLLNVLTPTRLCTLYGRDMRERAAGGILNIASTSALQPLPFLAAYAASKHYLLAFSDALADELAPRGVRVTTVLPGTTRTPFLDAAGLREGSGFMAGLAHRVAMSPERVAALAYEGFARGDRRVVPGATNRAHAAAAGVLPGAVFRRVASRLFGAGGALSGQ